jgi:PAS domain S-box-containing protein
MLEWLQRFFAAPVFPEDEEKTRIAFLLNPILITLLGVMFLACLALIFIFPEPIPSAIAILSTCGLLFIVRFLMVRGHVRNACRLLIGGLGLDIFILVIFGGGITSVNTIFYIALVIVSSLLLGSLATILLIISIVCTGIGMIILESANALPPQIYSMPPRSGLIILIFASILVASTLYMALHHLEEARNRYKQELAERKAIQAALTESEQRFHAIYDSVNDAIFVHDLKTGAILDVNQRMCEMYGYTRQEALQLTIEDLSQGEPPYTQRDAMGWFHRIPLGGSQLAEWYAKGKNGRLFWVEVNIRHTTIGGHERMLVVARDINERKKADQRRAALYRISDAARAAQDLDDFYQLIHAVIRTLMPARNFYIALFDPATELLSYPYFADEYDQPPPPHQIDKGLTAYVIRTGESVLATPDIFQQLVAEGAVENVGTPCIDWLGTPLRTAHGVIGVLAAQTYAESERLTLEDQDVLVFVSNQVAMMLARKRADEHDSVFSQGLRAVIEAADELIRCDHLDTLYRRAVELAREKIGVERIGLFLLDPAGQTLVGTYGTDDQGHTTEEYAATEPARNHPYLFNPSDRLWHVRTITRAYWERGIPYELNTGWVAGTVIRSLTQPIGILFNDSAISQAPLNEAIQETLAVYGSLLGNIIERKRLEERERDMANRLHAVVDCADELIRCEDLDTLYRRAVELAREKLNVERCAIFLLDEAHEYMLGTYGTDEKGQTTDEHRARWAAKSRPEILAGGGQTRMIRQNDQHTYWRNGDLISVNEGWVAFTLIHIADELFGVFCNDCAISHASPNETVQETIAIYCSLLGNIIDRKRSEERERDMVHRLHAVVDATDELIGCENLDTLYRRAVELAREKLNVERCSIFLLDETREYMVGTYGTNEQGQTSDEHTIQFSTDLVPEVFNRDVQKQLIHKQENRVFYIDGEQNLLNRGWVAGTTIRIADEPIGIFYNDCAISGASPNETIQETIAIYCSLLGNVIKRMRVETEQKRLITELEAKNSELERFAYTVSHDLKSPLITIRGFLGFLEKDAASGNVERFKTDIGRISEATNKMQQLLNGLLELSRVGRLMNPAQLVSFEDITREAIAIVHGQIDALGAEVVIQEGLPTVYGDRARLVEVIQNLLDNAVKFTSHQVNPRIEIGVREPDEAGKPVFFVRDNGLGIDPQFHERIFGLFNKLNTESEGTGIGLALVKRIIEFHDGRIWVESEGRGKGSTFYFTLPITDPQDSD